jgi:hypothetical protein
LDIVGSADDADSILRTGKRSKASFASIWGRGTTPAVEIEERSGFYVPVADAGAVDGHIGGTENQGKDPVMSDSDPLDLASLETRERASVVKASSVTRPIRRRRDVPVRIGSGFKIPAGGAPAGSRLGAMVGDREYYERLERDEDDKA